MREHHAKRLDHRLEFAHQLIDHDSGTLAGKLHYDDALAWRGIARHFEEISQADEGHLMRLANLCTV